MPHRVAGSVVWELPFKASNGLVNGLVGGWSVNATFQVQNGRPVPDTLDNVYFNGDPNTLKVDWSRARNGQSVFVDTGGFYFSDAAVQTQSGSSTPRSSGTTRASTCRTTSARSRCESTVSATRC